jgi:hypothetical protein
MDYYWAETRFRSAPNRPNLRASDTPTNGAFLHGTFCRVATFAAFHRDSSVTPQRPLASDRWRVPDSQEAAASEGEVVAIRFAFVPFATARG